jgi:imidazole glycerol-phosphate synthase subunit HisF
MQKHIRIIARLDIKGPNVVKGVHMEGLRVVGVPELYASLYYEQGIDELIYIDTVASLYGRNNLKEIVQKTAEEIFVPLTVGGGVRSVDDIKDLLRVGADKVAINTAAIQNPKLLKDAVKVFGSQCIVLSIQARQKEGGKYECLTDNARENSGKDVFEWAQEAYEYGVGEILVTSVDRDGTGLGYDTGLVSQLSMTFSIPVIACGGAGRKEHFKDVILNAKADAVCAASIFHYGLLAHMKDAKEYPEGNLDFLKQTLPLEGQFRQRINPTGINELKEYLSSQLIAQRQIDINKEKEPTLIDHETSYHS